MNEQRMALYFHLHLCAYFEMLDSKLFFRCFASVCEAQPRLCVTLASLRG